MANGFFLGGMAEGAMGAQQQALRERAQTEQTGLATRGLELQERQFANTVSQQVQQEADQRIASTMAIVGETIKQAVAVGRNPEEIRKAVMPLVQSAQAIAQRVGRDPASLDAQVQAQIFQPGAVETAGVAGRASGVQRVEAARAIEQQPDPAARPGTTPAAPAAGTPRPRVENVNLFENENQRVEAEQKLRGEFSQRSANFIVQRDFMDRIISSPTTGAGDIGLVFSYMKVLDPTSTVREGEFATATQAAGVPSSIVALYNKLIGGGKLDTTSRTQIIDAAHKYYGDATRRQEGLVVEYRRLARGTGVRPENVIVDFMGDARPVSTPGGNTWSRR